MPDRVIHWFRRDLRLDDNTALTAALRSGSEVVPVFILDDNILDRSTVGARRPGFLRAALEDLDHRLRDAGSRLLVARGDAPRVLNRIAEETGAWSLYFNRDYTPYARQRDTRATRGMQMTGVVTQAFADLLLTEPHQTVDELGRQVDTFDAFEPRWLEAVDLTPENDELDPEEGSGFVAAADLPASSAELDDLVAATAPGWPGATPADARARLDEFIRDALDDYGAGPSTSRLSAALRVGTISVRRPARAAVLHGAANPDGRPGAERFLRALARRDFAHHLLYARPDLAREPLEGSATTVVGGDEAYEAWARGETGDTEVDAAMRRLAATGFVDADARRRCAAFLVRDLRGDWRAGLRHFQRQLIDADLASNALGWQEAIRGIQ